MTPRNKPRERVHEAGTRALLDGFAVGDPDEVLKLRDVFHGLGDRSFGMLLFIATLPAFIWLSSSAEVRAKPRSFG